MSHFESTSSVVFAVGNAAVFGIEPVVMSETGHLWFRCSCTDGYGLKNILNVCAASKDECDLLVKLAAVMFGITPRTGAYQIGEWSSYLLLLVNIPSPEEKNQDDNATDDTGTEEQ